METFDRKYSQICKAHCLVCGNNVTTTKYKFKAPPTITHGIDWSCGSDIESLLSIHHSAVFIILMNDPNQTTKESDTLITTPDGRCILDADRLFNKDHIKKTLAEMKKKIVLKVYTKD
jgi:hypothetical protein